MSKHSTQTMDTRSHLQRLTITAVFIALACVAKFFQITIPILGTTGMHISAAGIFSTLPALLFGPVYGGAASGIVDVIGFFMAGGKDGPFVPSLTMTAVLGGVLKGLLWKLFFKLRKKKNLPVARNILLGTFGFLILFGLWNLLCVSFWPGFFWTQVLQLLKTKVSYATYGLLIVGGVGLVCMLTAKLMGKIGNKAGAPNVLQLLATLGVSNVVITTINTFILMDLYEIKSAFLVFYTPRLIEELIMVVIQSFCIAWVLVLVKKIGGAVIPKERI